MDSERENKSKDCNVKDLQANLFPLFPKMSGYFANYMIKSEPEEDPDEALKLRGSGSRDLFAINRESNYQAQSARWPTECQVLDEKIEHINYVPFVPESYYAASGLENQPKPSGDENGIIVYQYAPISAVNYFSRSSIGGSKFLLSTNICPEENTLKFESRFESGNLARAIRLTPNYYELHLRSDLYTHRYMQWFYFRITNMKKNFLYRFSIVNFTKDGSLYNSGLRPLMYSVKDSQLHSIGWRRCGDQITYFSNENLPEEYEDSQTTYTLTFTILFPHDQDTVYLASCYPYTYTNLQDYLTELSNHPVKSTFTTLRLLCKSLAGNNVNYITITSTPEELEDNKKKRAIVITGRVHPGETPSSWMMKGFIDFLTSDTSAAKELRDKFIFKIVPMLNPDGVIVGNNRCSLSGKDLNRQYRTVMREAYPSIWYTKLMVRRLIEECGVSLYCDLHGHSRKHNIFIYGCENRGRAQDKRLLEQIFPLMLHKNTADKFSFEDCSFRIQKGKEGTGRVVMWMMGITNSYTLEASFAGSTLGNRNRTHFSILDYELMGKSFCQTLLDFYDEEPKKEKLRLKILNRLSQEGSNADEPTNIMLSDYSSDDGSHQSSSEENIGDFNYSNKLITVPPSSPLLICPKAKPRRPKHKLNIKHQENARKPLQMRKASLTLSLSETNFNFCTESSSLDSDEDKSKPVSLKSRRKTHKKKHVKKKTQTFVDLSANKLFKIENNLKDIVENVIRTRSRLFLMWTEIDNLRDDNVRLGVKLDIVEQKLKTIQNIVDLEDLDVRELVQIISEELLDTFITEIETASEHESRDTPKPLELRSMRTIITAMATISDSERQNFSKVLNFNSNTTLVEEKEPEYNSEGLLTVTESESITVSPSMRQLLIESECGEQGLSSKIKSELRTTVITSNDTELETARENQNRNKEDTTETFATGESEDDFGSLSFKSCDGTRVAGLAEEDRAKNVTANDDQLLIDLRKALNFSIMNKTDINSTRIAIASSTERMLFINELLEKLTSNTSSLVKLDEC